MVITAMRDAAITSATKFMMANPSKLLTMRMARWMMEKPPKRMPYIRPSSIIASNNPFSPRHHGQVNSMNGKILNNILANIAHSASEDTVTINMKSGASFSFESGNYSFDDGPDWSILRLAPDDEGTKWIDTESIESIEV